MASSVFTGTSLRTLLRRARAYWIRLRTGSCLYRRGHGHQFHFHDAQLHHCTIEIFGSGNTVEIMPGARLWDVTLRLVGENLHCRIGPDSRIHGGHYILEDRGSRLEIGAGCTLYGPTVVVNEGGTIHVGDDCMIANGSDLRNSDGHSILDAATRNRINPARDIVLRNHVWVGAHCQILKGCTIGERSVLAARSVVTGDVPAGVVAGGVPARVLRENVDWDHRRL